MSVNNLLEQDTPLFQIPLIVLESGISSKQNGPSVEKLDNNVRQSVAKNDGIRQSDSSAGSYSHMKWFKHETDAHTNLKLQTVIDTFGVLGYGYYWICVELVGLQGENFALKGEKNWKKYLRKFSGVLEEEQEKILDLFAELHLIDKKALKMGHLYIPKMAERSDDYTKRVRRVSEHYTDNVHLEENRREESRTEEKRALFNQFWQHYPKKVAKQAAERWWMRREIDEKTLKEIITAIDRYAQTEQWKKEKKFIPNPLTFLNQGRWEDEIESPLRKEFKSYARK